jgi:hypothetical protein
MWQEIVEGYQVRYYLVAIVVCDCVLCTWFIKEEISIFAEPRIQAYRSVLGRHYEFDDLLVGATRILR